MTSRCRATAVISMLAVLVACAGVATAAGPLDHPGYAKAFSCSACHGFGGASRSDTMPILAGMNGAYLKKALADYAAGKRVSTEMEPYAKMANELGADDVAAYFANQKKVPTAIRVDPTAATRGRAAASQCAACHGPEGKGDAARQIPDLTGQPPGYLKTQMLLFKTEKRSPGDEPLKAMKVIMKSIPDETLADLAAYYSSLR
jgi:cytochrome c553